MGMVLPRCGREPLRHRRHVVANRNRRYHDYTAAGGNRLKARLGLTAVFWRKTSAARCRR